MTDNYVYCCYCSENLEDKCNFCLAKSSMHDLLTFPPSTPEEDELTLDAIFEKFRIAPKTRLELLVDFNSPLDDNWLI